MNPYSLGLVVSFANVGCGIPIQFFVTGTFSGDAKIDAVPEPASVMLLGGVLLLAAAGLRRQTR